VQRTGAGATRRQLAEKHPGVVFHLFQLLQQVGVLHRRNVSNAIAGRSHRGPKIASLIGDSDCAVDNFPLINQRRAANI
jgi:hypothetical protein